MNQEYPKPLFWAGVLLKSLSRMYLLLPGLLLLSIGIRSKTALLLGLLLLAIDFALALAAQLRIKRSFERGAGFRFTADSPQTRRTNAVIDTAATERDLPPDQDLLNG